MGRVVPLLILIVTANVALSTNKCGLSDHHYELFTKIHRNMNLTLDCRAVKKASEGAYLRLYGKPDNLKIEEWCLYGATSWTWVSDSTNIVDTLVRNVNFDKVAQTALLHRQAKYGCAARTVVRTTLTSRWEDHGLLCIYEKKAPQDLCTIDWSY